ncbi:cation:proton antiporter [Cellulomonas bogoriensis]|uniref:Cation/H+ exchanger transmembrane domain-containing protein n=1 Tax=Cellulomonas bogoriensis 69B4 = DSM 16987 TaxID=1386082 RepID=A0A0A0C0M8_9CELL|nr:cation:proton antiporter [Cellulomonas bogoriensis]KGM14198.1 hypothetical protein N869_02805 [Cellulomonas bogoriensis 69B4 = DSM 16987]
MDLAIGDPVVQVGVVLLTALLVHVVLGRLGLPVLLGLLVAGMLLGPGGVDMVPPYPIVEPLGEIGLLFVMFTAGLEIDLKVVARNRRPTVLFGLLSFACTALPAFGVALLLGFTVPAAVLLGALISSHTLVAYPMLMRLGLQHRLPVMAVVGGTLLTDTLALVLLALVLGPEFAETIPFGWAIPVVLLALLAAAALWGVPRLAAAALGRPTASRAERSLFAMVVLLGLATATEAIGTEGILGAFLAGITLNRALAEREELREHVEFLGRAFFVPFFFFWTGTLLELAVFLEWPGVWSLAALLLALVVVGKGAAGWFAGAVFGYTRRERVLMGALTAPQAAATLAVAITAHDAGLFTDEIVDAVVVVIFLTCLAGPILTQRIGRRLARDGSGGGPPQGRAPGGA